MVTSVSDKFVQLPLESSIWERVFTIAPLVIIGSTELDGSYDLAPKHMVTPLGWRDYYGFVCTPRHHTYHNIARTGVFTVSYPRPTQIVITSLTASSRCEDDTKPALAELPLLAASQVEGYFIEEAYLCLECELDRTIDGFDDYSLIIGRIVAAYVAEDSLRVSDHDDGDLLVNAPLLAYVNWGRFARIQDSFAFPFRSDFKR